MIGFPLFHGTSSHYLSNFEVGKPPGAWSFYYDALSLYRNVWCELQKHGVEPEWYEKKIVDQSSGSSNWRHGMFYVTPSRDRAMSYASHNAANGGELLTSCKNILERLRKINPEGAFRLEREAARLAPLLAGGGRPVLLEIGCVNECDVDPECDGRNALQDIEEFSKGSDLIRRVIGGAMNFRLLPKRGTISKMEFLEQE